MKFNPYRRKIQFLSVAYPNQDLLHVACLIDYMHVVKKKTVLIITAVVLSE